MNLNRRKITRDDTGHKPNSAPQQIAQLLIDEPAAPDERAFHDDDLALLGYRELRRQRGRLRLGLELTPLASAWAKRRLERLNAELKARRGRSSPAWLEERERTSLEAMRRAPR
jgi:hypothetical protein